MVEKGDYRCDFENKWCPGCGNFGIINSMKEAFAGMDLPPEKLLIVSGIGQAAKTPHFLKCNFFHGLHGRALPVATGARIANRDLNIVVNMGDGDCYGEGGNHFLAAVRRNINLTLLVHDNRVYGLTKGQVSPTSQRGFITRAQRNGARSDPINPAALALSQGAGFVARGYSGNRQQLSKLIQKALQYRGLALIDILQVCVSFNRVNTYEWHKQKVYDAEEAGHRPDDFAAAMELALKDGDKIPTGVIYHRETTEFSDRLGRTAKQGLLGENHEPEKAQALIDGA
ncbi:MAG: thiamine pyrophosphate-dependent enzyme [Desulfobacterales bacterium]